ncbi:hypothetical protein CQ14_08990 [Bradyrhizobium lablabi]|uniref:Uncharacterized protein n=1 Tax=Bradyrhizobium lablabi TaxID=722472 RepID=A0A0R3NC85_9BRAD|nr:hypothetical protein CQ14_08990 [Bradyrhizobium lablabi]
MSLVCWRRIRWDERYCVKRRHGHVEWICQALVKARDTDGMCSAVCRVGCDEPVKDFRKHSAWPDKACLFQGSGCKGIAVLGLWTILVTSGVHAGTEFLHLIPLRTEIITTGNHRMRLVQRVGADTLTFLRLQPPKPRICVNYAAIWSTFLKRKRDQLFDVVIELPFRYPLKSMVLAIGFDVVQHHMMRDDRSVIRYRGRISVGEKNSFTR